jgi:hypothetical protein
MARPFPSDYRSAECRLWILTLPGAAPNLAEAWRLVDSAATLAPEARREYDRHYAMVIATAVLARAGVADSARAVLLRARAGADVDPRQELPFFEAGVLAMLKDDDSAVALLRKMVAGATEQATPGASEWASHWWWRGLLNRPDFQALVRASR